MNIFNTLSSWIILSLVLPGLVTLAILYILLDWIFLIDIGTFASETSNWIGLSIAVSIMILTQTVGVVKERCLTNLWFRRIKPYRVKTFKHHKINASEKIYPAGQFRHQYHLLLLLRNIDDPHGHLNRIAGQFYLSVNTSAACMIGLLVFIVLWITDGWEASDGLFLGCLFLIYALTLYLVRIRYRILTEAIWLTKQLL